MAQVRWSSAQVLVCTKLMMGRTVMRIAKSLIVAKVSEQTSEWLLASTLSPVM